MLAHHAETRSCSTRKRTESEGVRSAGFTMSNSDCKKAPGVKPAAWSKITVGDSVNGLKSSMHTIYDRGLTFRSSKNTAKYELLAQTMPPTNHHQM